MIRQIIDAKNPILRKKSKEVREIDKKITVLARDLVQTLKTQKDPEGVGLAAPQVGKNLRMFAMVNKGKIEVIVNPKILEIEKTLMKNQKILEGCLSVPCYYGPITRAKRVLLSYQTIDGEKIKREFNNFPAQIVQHEIDHLDGKLFTDIILEKKLPLYFISGDDWEEVDFAKIK